MLSAESRLLCGVDANMKISVAPKFVPIKQHQNQYLKSSCKKEVFNSTKFIQTDLLNKVRIKKVVIHYSQKT